MEIEGTEIVVDKIEAIKEIKPERKYDCQHYDKCLNYAALFDALEIACVGCKLFKKDNRWRNDDPLAITALLLEIINGGEMEE